MITIDQMVQREVLCCMSSLVSTLTNGCGDHASCTRELCDLLEQASELVAPVLDYEEAARQAGYKTEDADGDIPLNWQAVCDGRKIDPCEREVFEHWAVSQWLADKLIAQGERVDTDFAGLYIWARTTTGEAVSMDGCMQRIYADMMAPHTLDSVAPGS